MHLSAVPDCPNLGYTLTATVTAPLTPGGEPQRLPYLLWNSIPADSLLVGQDNQPSVFVRPHHYTEYYVTADYRETPYCPVNGSITLTPVVSPHAELKVNPAALGYDQLDFTAYDISRYQKAQRAWYIDWVPQAETGSSLYRRADIRDDSIIVALELEIDDENHCRDTAVTVVPIYHVALFAPNVFTPLEETNNRFVIVGTGILDADLYIYNRQGFLVFRTTDLEQGWDGRDSNGTLCPQGGYVWKLFYHGVDHPQWLETLVGTVLLIR